MDLRTCPHCQTHVFPSSDGVCPACRKGMDVSTTVLVKEDAPWAPELPEPQPELVTVARFGDPIEANLARNRLQEGGVPAFLAEVETVGLAWEFASATGGIKLQVAESDEAKASALLRGRLDDAAVDPDGLVQEARRAPPEDDEARVEDDEDDEPDAVETPRDREADRVFRGAVLGIIFFPLQFYITYLIVKAWLSTEPLSERSWRRLLIGTIINVLCVTIMVGYVLATARVI